MRSFTPLFTAKYMIHPSTAWLMSQCAESKGMQKLWSTVRPDVLKKLTESAIIQSSESSNRIEGVEVNKDRLIPLVLGKAKPQDRPEEEIIGYRKALSWIHSDHKKIEINSKSILRLHSLAQGGTSGDAGKLKIRDNDIIELLPNGDRKVRFKCLSAAETPHALDQLCLAMQDALDNSRLPELLLVSHFILDFLCIHPFRDGNGRVSRLVTLLLLYKTQYEIGKYISLERIVETAKEDYYQVLYSSSQGWHDSMHDLLPWTNFFLGTVKSAYHELKDRVELTGSDSSSAIIRESVMATLTPFSLMDICRLHPNIDRELIKKVLYTLKAEKKLKLFGLGRGAKWIALP